MYKKKRIEKKKKKRKEKKLSFALFIYFVIAILSWDCNPFYDRGLYNNFFIMKCKQNGGLKMFKNSCDPFCFGAFKIDITSIYVLIKEKHQKHIVKS